MKISKQKIAGIFILLLWSILLTGQEHSLFVKKTNDEIKVDGILQEKVWQKASLAHNFTMTYPNDSVPALTKTIVKITYDDKMLYIGAMCFDQSKSDFVIQSLKRDFDFEENDAFGVYIDAFCDATSGITFAVNPYGVQLDAIVANGGVQGVTKGWDGLWYAEVFKNKAEGYWSVEMAIPFKSLRFNRDKKDWRINFARNDLKRNERSTWVSIPRGFNIAALSNMGNLIFESPPGKKQSNITLIPYVASQISKDYISPENNEVKHRPSLGFDAKVAVNSSLNLDVTVHPEFSQVDVDQQVIDLNRFELFFPERRILFLENSDLFSRIGNKRIRPFFTRRIGSVNDNKPVQIVYGARLSGKLGMNWRVGLMNVQTEKNDEFNLKAQNYTVAAIQRKITNGSGITAFLTNRQSFKIEPGENSDYNRVGGLQYEFVSKNSNLTGNAFIHYALTDEYKSNAYAYSLKTRYTKTNYSVLMAMDVVGENYITDMGYVPRLSHEYQDSTFRIPYGQFRLKSLYKFFIPKNQTIDFVGPEFNMNYITNEKFKYQEHDLELSFIVRFLNSSELKVQFVNYNPHLYFPFEINGLNQAFPEGNYPNDGYVLSYDTGKRSKLNGKASIGYGGEYMGNKLSFTGSLNYRSQPWGVFGLTFSHQNLMDFPQEYGEAKFTLVGSKLEFSFNKNLFFTTFLQYNTQSQNFNINSRFNWRFKPMSDLYIVYTENYDSEKIFIKDRALVLKLVYWLNL